MKKIFLIIFVNIFSGFYFDKSNDNYIFLNNYQDTNSHLILKNFKKFLLKSYKENKQAVIYLNNFDKCLCPWEINSLEFELNRTLMAISSSIYRTSPGIKLTVVDYSNGKFNKDKFLSCAKYYAKHEDKNKDVLDIDSRQKLFKNSCVTNLKDIDNYIQEDIEEIYFDNEDKVTELKSELPELNKNQRRIVVTGGSGFIGSYLCERLLNQGYQVVAIDNNFCSDKKNIKHLVNDKNFKFINFDITQKYTFDEHITDVLHFASVPSPEFYYNYPMETLKTGLDGTFYAYELAKKHDARFMFASTSEFYGDPEINPQPENYHGNVSCYGKRSQYDQSKRFAEVYLNNKAPIDNIDVRIVRIFNTYGPRMLLNDGRIVTNFIKSFLTNEPFAIHGTGKQTRSFCYVEDLVDGIIRLLDYNFPEGSSVKDKTFNIGNNKEVSITDACEIMNRVLENRTSTKCKFTYIDPIDLDDPKQRRPDLNKSNLLGYEPKTNFDYGFKKMFDYFYMI